MFTTPVYTGLEAKETAEVNERGMGIMQMTRTLNVKPALSLPCARTIYPATCHHPVGVIRAQCFQAMSTLNKEMSLYSPADTRSLLTNKLTREKSQFACD